MLTPVLVESLGRPTDSSAMVLKQVVEAPVKTLVHRQHALSVPVTRIVDQVTAIELCNSSIELNNVMSVDGS